MPPRKTIQRAVILRAMLEAPFASWYGLEIVRDSGLKSGTVYPALAALEQAGLLASHWEDVDPSVEGRPRRRLYQVVGDRIQEASAYVSQFDLALAPRAARSRTRNRRSLRERPA